MQHIHWLGTGLSSIPGIRRIATNYDNFTIWNRTLEKAEHSINHINKQNVVARKSKSKGRTITDLRNIAESFFSEFFGSACSVNLTLLLCSSA